MSRLRMFGNFAGGAAAGMAKGQQMKLAQEQGDMTKDLYDKQGKAFDEYAALARQHGFAQNFPTLAGAMGQASAKPSGAAPANIGGVEAADQLARTEAPRAEPSMLAKQMVAAPAPTPFVTSGALSAPAGTPTRLAAAGGARRLPFSPAEPVLE